MRCRPASKARADQLLAELRGLIGEERWPIIQTRLNKRQDSPFPPGRLLSRLNLDAGDPAQEIRLAVGTDATGTLHWHHWWRGSGMNGYVDGALSAFLPEGDPNRTDGNLGGGVSGFGGGVSGALRQRAVTWLQEQAIVRLGKKENP